MDALHGDRPSAQEREHSKRDGSVVLDQLALGHADRGKDDPIWVADADDVAVELEVHPRHDRIEPARCTTMPRTMTNRRMVKKVERSGA